MKKNVITYAVADPDFYTPLENAADREPPLRPADVPDGWHQARAGVWTMWYRKRPGGALGGVEQGWKVHVSARPGRLERVLDIAARVCFEQGVVFKHLSNELFYKWTHHKHAARSQSGKFVAAYPEDEDTARRLMERLAAELAAEEGPYVLNDRSFEGSRTVHYRYGAFLPMERLAADGTRLLLVRDGHGHLVEDRRGAEFLLPEGVTDPFVPPARPAGARPTGPDGPPTFGGFVFERAIRHSNGGGAYRGREAATGREVFIKEARRADGPP